MPKHGFQSGRILAGACLAFSVFAVVPRVLAEEVKSLEARDAPVKEAIPVLLTVEDLPRGLSILFPFPATAEYGVTKFGIEKSKEQVIYFEVRKGPVEKNLAYGRASAENMKKSTTSNYQDLNLGDVSYIQNVKSADGFAYAEVFLRKWQLKIRLDLKEDPEVRRALAEKLIRIAFDRLTGTRAPKIEETEEYKAFCGLSDPLQAPSVWEKSLVRWIDDLTAAALGHPEVTNLLEVPGETSRRMEWNLIEPTLCRLLALDEVPVDLAAAKSNVYAAVTATLMPALRAKLEGYRGKPMEPAEVLRKSLEVCGANYPLAVLTAHNLLKTLTKEGRLEIQVARDNDGLKTYPVHLKKAKEKLAEFNQVVQKLASLRQDPTKEHDKLGPWYHLFAVLTASAVGSPEDGPRAAGFEHSFKAAKMFMGEGGANPEKQAIDAAFAKAACEGELRRLSRNFRYVTKNGQFTSIVPFGWTHSENDEGMLTFTSPPANPASGFTLHVFLHKHGEKGEEWARKFLADLVKVEPNAKLPKQGSGVICGIETQWGVLELPKGKAFLACGAKGADGLLVAGAGEPQAADKYLPVAFGVLRNLERSWMK